MKNILQRSPRYFVIFLLALILSIGHALASTQNLVQLHEDKIDVGLIALTMAKEIYPDINVSSYSSKLDAIADEVRALAGGTQNPDRRIRCLNTVIYLYQKFRANIDSSFDRKPDNYYLNRVLDTKQGNCFSIPLLYVSVAQRLGWPVYLIHVPDHSFVRYVDSALSEQNIETTSGGGYVPDEKYAKDFLVSDAGRKSGAYLRSLTYRESLGDLATTNAITLGQRGQLPQAIDYLKMATKLNPTLVDAWANLVNAYTLMAKRTSDTDAKKYLELAATCSKKRDELGFVNPIDVPPLPPTRRPT